jgi:hypothetical protein
MDYMKPLKSVHVQSKAGISIEMTSMAELGICSISGRLIGSVDKMERRG